MDARAVRKIDPNPPEPMSTKTNTTPVDVTKITKGKWKAIPFGYERDGVTTIMSDCENEQGGKGQWVATTFVGDARRSSAEHDAALIAEAGTVANETGLSPLQMQERLEEAVRYLKECATFYKRIAKGGPLNNSHLRACLFDSHRYMKFLERHSGSTLTKHP